jgi:hypothetical protein
MQIFQADDQAVIEADGRLVLLLAVDAAKPQHPDWHIRMLAPVIRPPDQPVVHCIWWRRSTPDRCLQPTG